MNIRLLCFGRVKDRHIRTLIDEYERRLAHHNIRFTVTEWSYTDLKNQQDRIRSFLNDHPDTTAFLLDEHAQTLSTQRFADTLEKVKGSGKEAIFILGDAHGFEKSFKEEFSDKLSLSPMTFPHEIARLLLTEQLYRIATLWNHIPYHK